MVHWQDQVPPAQALATDAAMVGDGGRGLVEGGDGVDAVPAFANASGGVESRVMDLHGHSLPLAHAAVRWVV